MRPKKSMNRLWHNFKKWEDWKAGQYCVDMNQDDLERIMAERCASLLSSPWFDRVISDVLIAWPYASEQQLTNTGRNRRAWLGQAACCAMIGAPDYITKSGWHMMSAAAQMCANDVAERRIAEWERRHA